MEQKNINNYQICYYDNNWQKPVITEQCVFQLFTEQNSLPFNYFAFPWASYIDNKWKYDQTLNIVIDNHIKSNNSVKSIEYIKYFTVVQHINFIELLPIFKKLNIKYVFTPHKENTFKHHNLEKEYDLKLIPFSLFPKQNNENNNIIPIEQRKYLTSFIGQYDPNCYMSDIRVKIFEQLSNYSDCYIISRNTWHYESVVYQNKNTDKNNELEYKFLLANSCFSLCPSGSGPNSLRIWESLSFGSIPVILTDTLEFPEIKNKNWNDYFIFWPENNFHNLYTFMQKMDKNKLKQMSMNCINLYNEYFSPDTMNKTIIEYFEKNKIDN